MKDKLVKTVWMKAATASVDDASCLLAGNKEGSFASRVEGSSFSVMFEYLMLFLSSSMVVVVMV